LPSGTLFAAAISEQEVTRGHSKMDGDCVAFETDCEGELAEFAATDDRGRWLAEAERLALKP
jgi:hypothetical protein